jgi:hypothetical protein
MNTTYSNPNVPLLVNPINLDAEIQYIQTTLSLLPWLERSFGRARTAKDEKEQSYPEVYKGGGEYHNVLANDHFRSQSFVRVRTDSGKTVDYSGIPQIANNFIYPIDVIFWFDLKKIDPIKNYRFDEELKRDVTELLKTIPQMRFIKVWEAYEDVFQGYTYSYSNPNKFRYPFGGFRFEGEILFTEMLPGCEPYPTPTFH